MNVFSQQDNKKTQKQRTKRQGFVNIERKKELITSANNTVTVI